MSKPGEEFTPDTIYFGVEFPFKEIQIIGDIWYCRIIYSNMIYVGYRPRCWTGTEWADIVSKPVSSDSNCLTGDTTLKVDL